MIDRLVSALSDRYTIERELGAGGMATVYLAHDVRHDRKVALKVLRPELAAVIGAERFLAEIKTTANLQHPHILPLFDSGQAGESAGGPAPFLYYVMPLVEGESLRDRLQREKQLPVDDAVRIAREVADALDYAHRHHVVHRDIKPENVMLHDGRAVVADFGIALAVTEAGGTRMTETGLSLGTPHYMSPEQAMGERDLDGRSDIYALGIVLYEMLAGEPPFTGPSAQAVVAKVMTAVPEPVTTYRKTVPPHVETVLGVALQKLPADRFQTAREFSEALAGDRPLPGPVGHPEASPRRAVPWPVAAGGAAIALGVGWLAGAVGSGGEPPRAQPTRLQIATLGISRNPGRTLELSPDGTALVYEASTLGGGSAMHVRRLDAFEPTRLPGLTGPNPTVSPKGRDFLFTVFGRTFRGSLTGGEPTFLEDVPESPYITLSERGDVIYLGADGALWMLREGGDRSVRVGTPDSAAGERRQHLTDVLPGGRRVLAYINTASGQVGRPYVLDVETGDRRYLLDMEVRGVWFAGHETLVYATPNNMVHAVRVDPRTLEPVGDPVVLGGPVAFMPTGMARVSTSRTGSVVYQPQSEAELVYVTPSGEARRLIEATAEYHNPRFSPDGRRLAMDITEASGRDLWVLSLDQGTLTRVTFDNDGHDAIWAADGSSLVYLATPRGVAAPQLLRAPLDGTGGEVMAPVGAAAPAGWTEDGRLVFTFSAVSSGSGWDIFALDSLARPQPILDQRFSEGWPSLSPDGRWLAYSSDESNRYEIYVRSLTGPPVRIQISVDGGSEPMWDPDGRRLYYHRTTAEAEFVAATLDLDGPEPRVTDRETLFSWNPFDTAEPHPNYDVDPNGGGFAMVRRLQPEYVVLIQNVQELVRRENER